MQELVDFLRTQLDADERVAREAAPGPWRVAPCDNSPTVVIERPDRSHEAPPGLYLTPYVVPPDTEYRDGIEPADAEHIARWDPARVLRLTAALRKLLDEYSYEGRETAAIMTLAEALYADREGYRDALASQ